MRFLNVFCSEFSAWADHIPSNFLKDVFHKFYLVHSWIICPISMWFLAPYGTILNHTSTFFCPCCSKCDSKDFQKQTADSQRSLKIKSSRNLQKIFRRFLWRNPLPSKIKSYTSSPLLKLNPFTDLLQRFCLIYNPIISPCVLVFSYNSEIAKTVTLPLCNI